MSVDKNVVSASVTSVLSESPVLFRTEENVIGVALFGALMPYRVFVMCAISALTGTSCILNSYTNELDVLRHEIRSLYNKGVKVPSKYLVAQKGSPSYFYETGDEIKRPWVIAEQAVSELFEKLRSNKDEKDPKIEIANMLREVEREYAELYIPPTFKENETDFLKRCWKIDYTD